MRWRTTEEREESLFIYLYLCILDDGADEEETANVYFSYNLIDSPSAHKHHEVNKALIPESYLSKYQQMCDPANIENFIPTRI